MKKSKYFELNKNGEVELKKEFPKQMTWKRALDLVIEKAEFALSILENGGYVSNSLRSDTCACCLKADNPKCDPQYCGNCPLQLAHTSKWCVPIIPKLQSDTRKNGGYRIPHIRTALKQLYAVKEDMNK